MAIIDISNNISYKEIDRTHGIKEVITTMNGWGVDIKNSKTLDMFAGDGSWCSNILLPLVSKNSVCWDINSDKLKVLNQNYGLKTVNSDVLTSIKNNQENFDIIHCDNPSSVYGENTKRYEYFDVIPYIKDLFSKECIFIHNLNTTPYNFNPDSNWAKKRSEFYNLQDTSDLNPNEILSYHINYFKDQGIKVSKSSYIAREMYNGNVYWWYLVYKLNK
tara:strand:+ start:13114 stop:13767 length:654 start_codon:yes stop_codon:yes gene_type:complete